MPARRLTRQLVHEAPRGGAILLLVSLLLVASCGHGNVTPVGKAAGTMVHPVADGHLVWSPYNWVRNGRASQSPTVGAYVDVAFTGPVVGVRLDPRMRLTRKAAGLITLSVVVDGHAPERTTLEKADARHELLWDGLGNGAHQARITIAGNLNIAVRWKTAAQAMVQVDGVVTRGPLRHVAPSTSTPRNVTALFYGDSITEGNDIGKGGTFGDNSFPAVALDTLGYRFGIKGYSALTWEYSTYSRTPSFVYTKPTTPTASAVWRNAYKGSSLLTSDTPPRFRDGTPDVVFNNVGTNDVLHADPVAAVTYPTAKVYLAAAIEGWLEQLRAVTGPRTVIVMVVPIVLDCSKPVDRYALDAIQVTRTVYLEGIANYREAHKGDTRVLTVDLGAKACTTFLSHPHFGVHPGPVGAKLLGTMLAKDVGPRLADLLG